MMTKQLNPDKIAEQYQLYKQAREARLAQGKELEKQLSENQAFWNAKKEISNKPVTCRKSHLCTVCGRTIAAGEQATVKAKLTNIAVGSGWTPGFITLYTCSKCKPKKEEQ